MKDELIRMEEIMGRTITDIRCKYGIEDGWLDTAECFIELDHTLFIQFPGGQTEGVFETAPDPDAKTIFTGLSDIPDDPINKDSQSMPGVAGVHKRRKLSIADRINKLLSGYEPPLKESQPHKATCHENRLKHILNRTITDYLWETERRERGIFELDNGYLITEQYMAPSGTGLAGLHYYDSLDSLKKLKGENIGRFSDLVKGSR